MIPVRTDAAEQEDKDRRFYVFAPESVFIDLQIEAKRRSVQAWYLGGLIIKSWIEAGCPDSITPRTK